MSKFDEVWKKYFSDNRRVADLMNMFCYHGEQVVHPEDISEADPVQGKFARDTVRKVVCGQKVMICGIESQETMDYSMAARIMGYYLREYEKQIKTIRNMNKDAFKKGCKYEEAGEYLYNFLRTDRLDPAGTIVIYSGGKWTGPRSLWELCGLNKKMGRRLKIVNDYPLHIIEIKELTEERIGQFRSDVKQVFSLLKYLGKKDKIKEIMRNENYAHLSDDAGELIEAYCGKHFRSMKKEVDQMSSIREDFEKMMREEREEGRDEGIKALVEDNIDENVPEERIVRKLMKYFALSEEDADKYVKKFATKVA